MSFLVLQVYVEAAFLKLARLALLESGPAYYCASEHVLQALITLHRAAWWSVAEIRAMERVAALA